MAKNKVINTVLTLKDEMSGGLVAAAKAAKKSGKNIDDSMMQATRKVVAFKNKSLTALGDFAKKGVKATGAAVAGLTAAFVALDGATEEYRVAQGKLNAGFQTAGFSADVARKSYRNFYAILGDTDTATEASQLLANMAKNEEEVTKWTRIAAGVHGTFGDSLPIEGLVESANETARTGKVTGVFADALNWVGIMEDDFNAKLEQTTDVSKRNRLIMDTLSTTYDKAANSFYANNQQVINARRNHATLDETLAKVGDTSSKVKNQLWVLAGAADDGSIRSGSALDWVQQKAEAFGAWVEGLDLSALKQQFDENFTQGLQRAGDAMDWCREHADGLKTGVKLLAVAFGLVKLAQFNQSVAGGASALLGMGKTVLTMTGVLGGQTAATGAVILLIEGAIAVGVLLYKNWDTVKAKAGEVWTSIKTAFGGIRDSITGAFSAAKNKVAGFFSWLDQKIESVPILGSIYKGGKNAVSWIADRLDGNAMGTPYFSGGLTRVNERGGEIMNLPSGTQIIPHDVSVKAAGGRSVTVNINIQGNLIGNREYTEQVGEYVGRKVLAALGNT